MAKDATLGGKRSVPPRGLQGKGWGKEKSDCRGDPIQKWVNAVSL
jgi:hypothetical protein